jgi:predicted transcriptional regulator
MLTIDQIREALKDRNLMHVAEQTGVSYSALHRLATGAAEPNYTTVKAIAEYLQQQAATIISPSGV